MSDARTSYEFGYQAGMADAARAAAQPAGLVLATWRTTSFTFQATGTTHDEAAAGLRRAWAAHCADYPRASITYVDEALADDGEVTFLTPAIGGMYRDGQPLG